MEDLSARRRRAPSSPISARRRPDRHCSVDTPIPYRMGPDLIRYLRTRGDGLAQPGPTASRHISWSRPACRRCSKRSPLRVHVQHRAYRRCAIEMSDILAQLFRIPVSGKPITILDLSGVPSEVLECRRSGDLAGLTFDFSVWSETQIPITIVCEEAHRYAAARQGRCPGFFEPVKRSASSRIAKEGRKYGVSPVRRQPTSVGPRGRAFSPSAIRSSALRMTSQEDQDIIRGALPRGFARADEVPAARCATPAKVRSSSAKACRCRCASASRRCPTIATDQAQLHRLVHHRLVARCRRPLRGRTDRRALAAPGVRHAA